MRGQERESQMKMRTAASAVDPLPCPARQISAVTFGRAELAGAVFEIALPKFDLLRELPSSEREVAVLLFDGYSIAAIAQIRQRSRFTIMNQVQSLYRRLQVGSRRELAQRLCCPGA